MIDVLGPLLMAVALAAPIEATQLKSEFWVSAVGLFRIKVPRNWHMAVKADAASGMAEDLRVGPKKEPTVSLTVLTRRHNKPMTSIDCDAHLRTILAGYKKDFKDVTVERGPNRVPVGNLESWGYLVIYNTKASDGSKVSVRETVNYVNRRMNDQAYLHHILVGRCPLPVAYTYSPVISRFMENLMFQLPEKWGSKKPGATEEEDEEDEALGASPAAGKSPAAEASPEAAPASPAAPARSPRKTAKNTR